MKISEISPVLYGVNFFKYSVQNNYAGILSEKSQYVCRFLCITKGSLSVFIGDREEKCSAGDVIFLTPGQKYRLCPDGGDFSLYNIFFDFVRSEQSNRRKHRLYFPARFFSGSLLRKYLF